jgi:8-oxo-dGTP diphosphatase
LKYHIHVRACALILNNDAVLLIEFKDENGIHYNLPAGGAEPGESVNEAVIREAKEEASVDIEVGPIAFVYEYAPHLNQGEYGDTHSLSLMFDCTIKEGSRPSMPLRPDENQSAVRWIPLRQLDEVVLYPNIKQHIIEFAANRSKTLELIEEHRLERIG